MIDVTFHFHNFNILNTSILSPFYNYFSHFLFFQRRLLRLICFPSAFCVEFFSSDVFFSLLFFLQRYFQDVIYFPSAFVLVSLSPSPTSCYLSLMSKYPFLSVDSVNSHVTNNTVPLLSATPITTPVSRVVLRVGFPPFFNSSEDLFYKY